MIKHSRCPDCKQYKTDDIICNMCGKSCKEWCNHEYAQLSACWGYDSPWDSELHEAHFCIECYKKIKKFIEDNGGQIDMRERPLV